MGRSRGKRAGGPGSEAPTHNERQTFGYGTHSERLGKDALLDFDKCNLTLNPLEDPVATNDGVLFSRAAILECLLAQKQRIKRSAEQADASRQELGARKAAVEEEERARKLRRFDELNHGGGAAAAEPDGRAAGGAGKQSAYWLPSSHAPEPAAAPAQPPPAKPEHTTCPVTGKRLRLKDLITVRFTRVPGGEQEAAFMCPISRDVFSSKSKLVLLRPTGDVLLESSYETAVKPEGTYKGVAVNPERDVIPLRAGRNTGFASANNVEASKTFIVGRGSGLADLRGQGASARSRFALAL